jgi:hypothetical protein
VSRDFLLSTLCLLLQTGAPSTSLVPDTYQSSSGYMHAAAASIAPVKWGGGGYPGNG